MTDETSTCYNCCFKEIALSNKNIDEQKQDKVLLSVVQALYFDDSSDYRKTLEYVLFTVDASLYEDFLKNPRDVLKQHSKKMGIDIDD